MPVPPADPLGAQARAWLGEPTAEIVNAVADKARFIETSLGVWPSDADGWAAATDILGEALALAQGVPGALDVLSVPSTPGYLGVDEPMLRATFHLASRLRARYTTIDFLEGQAMLDDAIETILG
jgi:hypothetical protein